MSETGINELLQKLFGGRNPSSNTTSMTFGQLLNLLSNQASSSESDFSSKSDGEKAFNAQCDTAAAIVKANAVSALDSTGLIKSLRAKINSSTVTWSSEAGFALVHGLMRQSNPDNRTAPLSEEDFTTLRNHVLDILATIFDVHKDAATPPTKETISSIGALMLMAIVTGEVEVWEFLNTNMVSFVRKSQNVSFANKAFAAAYMSLEDYKQNNSANTLTITRGVHELVTAALAVVESLPETNHKTIRSVQRLLKVSNVKQLTGLYDILFTSYITLADLSRYNNEKSYYNSVACTVADWAGDLLKSEDFFQGEMADRATTFAIAIFKLLSSYVDWSAPYKAYETEQQNSSENDNNAPAKENVTTRYEATHVMSHYISFAKYLLKRSNQERTAVALDVERILANNESAPWVPTYARAFHKLVSDNLSNRTDYLDSGVVHLLTTLNQAM